MLQHIVEQGAPAQAEHARSLLDALAHDPASPDIEDQAEALIEAFLHDPYLTR